MQALTEQEFVQFQRFIFDAAGISLPDAKLSLVSSRLLGRMQECGIESFGDYLRLLIGGSRPLEVQTAVDLLTTNETYFFREPAHFDFLRERLTEWLALRQARPLRVWSAAGSTGEEAYSIAMVLEDHLRGRAWEVLASDISSRVLKRARAGHYSMDRARNIPLPYLQRFCLKGVGKLEQTLLIQRNLRNRVQFRQINLNAPLPNIGEFDLIFLRNVLIYFDKETKCEVVGRVFNVLRSGGWLLVGHAENLHNVADVIKLAPSIYQKP